MGIVKRADQIAVGEYGKHLSQLNKQAATEMVRLALIEIEAEDHNKKFRIQHLIRNQEAHWHNNQWASCVYAENEFSFLEDWQELVLLPLDKMVPFYAEVTK